MLDLTELYVEIDDFCRQITDNLIKQVQFSGSGYVDSTPLEVCSKKRTSSHKVFKIVAKLGKSSKGWFFGFKLHIICDFNGNLVSCKIISGNENDLKAAMSMFEPFKGKIFADKKGYLGKKEFEKLLAKALVLVTGIKKNMLHLEHSRHRSIINAAIYLVTTLIAYCLKPSKPKIKFNRKETLALQSISLLN